MATVKKTIQGKIYHRIEKLGGKKYEHIGFEDPAGNFGQMLASFVPKIGMEKKAKLTIEVPETKKSP